MDEGSVDCICEMKLRKYVGKDRSCVGKLHHLSQSEPARGAALAGKDRNVLAATQSKEILTSLLSRLL